MTHYNAEIIKNLPNDHEKMPLKTKEAIVNEEVALPPGGEVEILQLGQNGEIQSSKADSN